MKKTFSLFLLVGVFSWLLLFGSAQEAQANKMIFLPEVTLVAPKNAIYTYLYSTPIYDVAQDQLHIALFHLSETHILNLWNFYYPAGTKATVVGQDETGYFFLVIVGGSGQVGWVPINEIADPSTLPYPLLKTFYHPNMPRLGAITLPQ